MGNPELPMLSSHLLWEHKGAPQEESGLSHPLGTCLAFPIYRDASPGSPRKYLWEWGNSGFPLPMEVWVSAGPSMKAWDSGNSMVLVLTCSSTPPLTGPCFHMKHKLAQVLARRHRVA